MTRNIAAVLATGVGVVAMATPAAAQVREFNVPAGSLQAALDAYARQSGRQVIYRADDLRGARSAGARGSLSASAALEAILAGSGFSVRTDQSGALAIVRSSANSPPAVGEAFAGSAAADDEIAEEGEDIVVTGTRIRGARLDGPAPVTVVSKRQIEQSGAATVGDALLQTVTQAFGSEKPLQTATFGSNPSFATAISLRGLGSSSTLTLVNGRRAVTDGGGQGAFTDVSSIPIAAVQRVEVLTSGSSAIYGSDALAGVVNIVLARDYKGADLTARAGDTYRGDLAEYAVNGVAGTRWSTGNILVAGQFNRAQGLFRANRDFSDSDDLRQFGGADLRSTISNPGTIRTDAPTIRLPVLDSPIAGIPAGQDGRNLTIADLATGAGVQNRGSIASGGSLTPRIENYSGFLSARQSVGSAVELSMEAFASRRTVEFASVYSFPIPFVTVPGRATPTTIGSAFNPFPTPVNVEYLFTELGPNTAKSRTDTFQVNVGADIKISEAWAINAVGGTGESKFDSVNRNLVNNAALRQAVDPMGALIANPVVRAGYPVLPVPELTVFGNGTGNDPRTLDFIRQSATIDGVSRLRYVGSTITGPLFELPGGDLKLAIGGEYRSESFDTTRSFQVSALYTPYFNPVNGRPVLAPPPPPTSLSGSRRIEAGYAEIFLPVFSNEKARPFLNKLEFSAAIRHERYSDFGSTTNPQVGVAWEPFEGITIRGSYAKSFHAPLLSQLFGLAFLGVQTQVFDARNGNALVIATVNQGANPDLKPETANVLNAGVVIAPDAVPGLRAEVTYYKVDFTNRILSLTPSQIVTNEAALGTLITRSPTGVLLTVDARSFNSGQTITDGIDFQLGYSWQSGLGRSTVNIGGTNTNRFSSRLAPGLPAIPLVDTFNSPTQLRLRGSYNLDAGPISFFVAGNYVDSYDNPSSAVSRTVDSHFTIDTQLVFRIGEESRGRSGLDFVLGARNLLDKRPPFVNVSGGYDPANASPVRGAFYAEARVKF